MAALAVAWSALWTWGSIGAAQGPLATATGLRCTFSRVASGTWGTDGAPDAKALEAALVLRFVEIDADASTAQLRVGAAGTDVTARAAGGYLHFMQSFRTGPMYTTTVFEAGARDGRFKAVHSRHEFFTTPVSGATSNPEQYYGECEIVEAAPPPAAERDPGGAQGTEALLP